MIKWEDVLCQWLIGGGEEKDILMSFLWQLNQSDAKFV
jgi:hypothetical protein